MHFHFLEFGDFADLQNKFVNIFILVFVFVFAPHFNHIVFAERSAAHRSVLSVDLTFIFSFNWHHLMSFECLIQMETDDDNDCVKRLTNFLC